MTKDSFIFYTEYREAVECMTDAQAGALLKALIAYSDGKKPVIKDQTVNIVFLTIKPRIDRDREKWIKTVTARSEAGKQGGAPRGNSNASKQAKTNKNKQNQTKQTKQAVSDTDTVTDTVLRREETRARTRETPAEMFDRLIVGRAVGHEIADVLRDEWLPYKQERREPYKETGMKTLITQAVNASARCGPSAVVELIRSSIASGYKGIVWDRLEKQSKPSPTSRFNNADERAYDMSETEMQLLKASGII